MQTIELHIFDIDETFCQAAAKAFAGTMVAIHQAPLATAACDALVHAGNAHGMVVSGQDQAFIDFFGPPYQMTLDATLRERFGGTQPPDDAVLLSTDHPIQRKVVHVSCFPSSPTTAFVAMSAVLRELRRHNEACDDTSRIQSLGCSGLGTFRGCTHTMVTEAAMQMRAAYDEYEASCRAQQPPQSTQGKPSCDAADLERSGDQSVKPTGSGDGVLEATIHAFQKMPSVPKLHDVAQRKYGVFCRNRTAELYTTFWTLLGGPPDLTGTRFVPSFNACVPFPGKTNERPVSGMAKKGAMHGVIRYEYKGNLVEKCRQEGREHGLRVVCTQMGDIWIRLFSKGKRLAQIVLSSDRSIVYGCVASALV